MAFFGKHSCFSFTAASIRQNAPPMPGVYGLSNAREWLFVGSADNVQEVLYSHLGEAGTELRSKRITGFTFELCDASACADREQRLIFELRPRYNQPSKS
jgi:excinuclease UvrABC nuclease subunit